MVLAFQTIHVPVTQGGKDPMIVQYLHVKTLIFVVDTVHVVEVILVLVFQDGKEIPIVLE